MKALGLSPGFKFEPDDDELVEHFLVPRLLHQRVPLDGIIIDDDPLSAPPWTLLGKHGREEEEAAFFFATGQAVNGKAGSRQKKRTCKGGGCWKGQTVCVDGEKLRVGGTGMEIVWRKYMLNFHAHGEEGSTGWVMHEYAITSPADLAALSMRLYRIRLSGHGKKSKIREPDLLVEEPHPSEPSRWVSPPVVVDLTADNHGPDLGASAGAPAAATSSTDQGQPAGMTDELFPSTASPAIWTTSSSDQDLFLDFEVLENIDFDEFFILTDLDPCVPQPADGLGCGWS